MAINRDQQIYRIRTDNTLAEGGTPIWGAAQNTGITIAAWTSFRIRFAIANTGTTSPGTAQYEIYYSLNGSAYALVPTTTTGTNPVFSTDATLAASPDNSAITTSLLTGAAGIFLNGQYDFNNFTSTFILSAGNYTELEYGLQLISNNIKNGDTITFQVRANNSVIETYTQTATVTVTQGATQAWETQVSFEEFVTFKDSLSEQAQVTYMVLEHWMSAASLIPEQAIVTKMVLEHWQSVTPFVGPSITRAMFLP